MSNSNGELAKVLKTVLSGNVTIVVKEQMHSVQGYHSRLSEAISLELDGLYQGYKCLCIHSSDSEQEGETRQ